MANVQKPATQELATLELATQKLISQKKVPAIAVTGEKTKVEKAKIEKVKTKSQTAKKSPNSVCKISEEERRQMVAINAYFRAQSRNFSPCGEKDDWLAAEAEINEMFGKSGLD